jgi:hypothetical protein
MGSSPAKNPLLAVKTSTVGPEAFATKIRPSCASVATAPVVEFDAPVT